MKKYHISLKELAALTGIPYASLRRWRGREARGQPSVFKPGPKKIEPLDYARFEQELATLKHGPKRSLGSGAVHASFREALSRREIDETIAHARIGHNASKRAQNGHVEWLRPNLVWAMDDTQFAGGSDWIHTIRDLSSRYNLDPLAGPFASGIAVAVHLETLFRQYGAPLFIKRDNGGNLNSAEVNTVLAKWHVIPINSPIRCPQYNGAIENAQKDWDKLMDAGDPDVLGNLQGCSELAAHKLNHIPRKVLNNRIPCTVFNGPDKLKVNKRYRKNAYEWIEKESLRLIAEEEKHPACAWRTAVLIWLHMNQYVKITRPKCVTPFSTKKRS